MSASPSTPPGLRLPSTVELPLDNAELDRSGLFSSSEFRRYEWEVSYSTTHYLDLLNTYSGHRSLDPTSRAALLDWIGQLIDARFGGRITKRYLARTACRRSHSLRR
jgi:hypothetical protein